MILVLIGSLVYSFGNSNRSRHSHSAIVPQVLQSAMPVTSLLNMSSLLLVFSRTHLRVGHSSFINSSTNVRETLGPKPSGRCALSQVMKLKRDESNFC